jgi:lipoate-protein ligase A
VILIDNRGSRNPYVNLAIEEYLLRHVDTSAGQSYLHLYINTPCIVLGKNQSIYKEVNFEYLRNEQLQLARRISGGGTVYQDEGNLCFSFITKHEDAHVNNYVWFNKPLMAALQKAGVAAEMDERNSILCQGKKISGNAQFTNRKNILSHGTLLFDAHLPTLRASLKVNDFEIETRAVSSVPKSVQNINQFTSRFNDITEFRQYLIDELCANSIHSFTDVEWHEIEQLSQDKFAQSTWIYGRTPLTTIRKSGLTITVEDGLIAGIAGEEHGPLKAMVGVAYQYGAIKKALSGVPNASAILERVF